MSILLLIITENINSIIMQGNQLTSKFNHEQILKEITRENIIGRFDLEDKS